MKKLFENEAGRVCAFLMPRENKLSQEGTTSFKDFETKMSNKSEGTTALMHKGVKDTSRKIKKMILLEIS